MEKLNIKYAKYDGKAQKQKQQDEKFLLEGNDGCEF